MNIVIENPVWCRAEGKEAREKLLPHLSYKAEAWHKRGYGMQRKEYRKSLIEKNGHFLAGFRPRVTVALHGDPPNWVEEVEQERLVPQSPSLPNLTLRPDQLSLIRIASEVQRGVIKAPTGVGKTVLAMGLISCFPETRVLFLVNELTLMQQTWQAMKDQECADLFRYGGDFRELPTPFESFTLVGMTQSIVKLPISYLQDSFDIIIVDEADLGMGPDTQLYKILTNSLAPVRIGFSATLPQKEESRLYLEGLLGPVIGEMTVKEGVNMGLLAKPKARMVPLPTVDLRDLSRYSDIYDVGVVENERRNHRIVDISREYVKQGKTVLILVTKIRHGENISAMAKSLGLNMPFVYGETESEERNRMRLELHAKNQKCVISNAVWRRGINIPSLGVVINAAGEKSETQTIQRIGRGFRKAEGKDEIIIVDFLDRGKYLADHCVNRMSVYAEEGWL